MKWIALAALAAAVAVPAIGQGKPPFKVLPIGNLPKVDTSGPAQWGMSGMTILTVDRGLNGDTPYERTAVYDARLVEILSRVQAPPLRKRDITYVRWNGNDYVTVRGYLMAEVTPRDARAADTSVDSLASKWVNSMKYVFPQITPPVTGTGV